MSEQLIYEINNTKHLLMVFPMLPSTDTDKLEKYLCDNNIITQSATNKYFGSWLFGRDVLLINLLVPEGVILDFTKQKFRK